MKHCKTCNADLEDDAQFCPFCGSPQTEPVRETPDTAKVESDAVSTPAPDACEAPAEGNPFLATMDAAAAPVAPAASVGYTAGVNMENVSKFHKIFGSTPWLVVCIITTVFAAATFLTNLISDIVWHVDAMSIIMTLIMNLVFPVLVMSACWLCWLSNKNKTTPEKGLRFFKGLTMAYYVFFWIVVVLLALLAILCFSGVSFSGVVAGMEGGATAGMVLESSMLIIGVVMLIVDAVVFAVGVFFFKAAFGYLKSSINSLFSREPIVKSGALSVFLFVIAGLSIFGALMNLIPMDLGELAGVVGGTSVVTGVFNFLFSILSAVGTVLMGLCIRKSTAVPFAAIPPVAPTDSQA